MERLTLILLSMALIGCGDANFEPVEYQCSIMDNMLVCPDGTTATLPRDGIDGRDGADGIDGLPGIDGVAGSIVDVIDPCGDYIHNGDPDSDRSYDELILRFGDGTILAWFQGFGFTVLRESVQYQTTDRQRCNFQIIAGQVVSQ